MNSIFLNISIRPKQKLEISIKHHFTTPLPNKPKTSGEGNGLWSCIRGQGPGMKIRSRPFFNTDGKRAGE